MNFPNRFLSCFHKPSRRRGMIARVLCATLCLGFFISRGALALTTNDPGLEKQWYLKHLDVPAIWDIRHDSSDIVVAIIDSGVAIDHEDLHDNIWVNQREISGDGIDNDRNGYVDDIRGWDFVDDDNDPRPSYTADCFESGECLPLAAVHGSFVAGIIGAAGNNGRGISGISWEARLMPLRALGANGSGNVIDVIAALRYAVRNGAKVVNLSFVGFVPDEEFREALQEAYDAGVLVVAAAGNAGTSTALDLDATKVFPVCFDALDGSNIVLGVSATDEQNRLAGFSNYGSSCIDVAAPGKNFYGVGLGDSSIRAIDAPYAYPLSGTSLAAPIVSGVAALVRAQAPRLPLSSLMKLLSSSGTSMLNLAASDFSGKESRRVIDPVSIFYKIRDDAYRLGGYVAALPLRGAHGRVKILNSRGETEQSVDFSAGPRTIALAGTPDGFVATGADGKHGLSEFIFEGGAYQLTKYRVIFSEAKPGKTDAAYFENSRGVIVTSIAAPAANAGTVFSYNREGLSLHSFTPFGGTFAAGVNIGVGNIDGDPEEEVVVGAGSGGGPQVRIFENGANQGQFFAFDPKARYGAEVAVGNVAGNGEDEIIAAPSGTALPWIRIYANDGKLLRQWKAYDRMVAGVNLAVGDVLIDEGNEIVVAPKTGALPIRVFGTSGKLLTEWWPEGEGYDGGYEVAVVGRGMGEGVIR